MKTGSQVILERVDLSEEECALVIAFIRTIILYCLIIAGVRLMGKRQVGELEPSELVLALIIADLAAVPMQDFGIPLFSGIIPILTLLCLTMLISVFSMRSIRFRALICGKPSIIVENGTLHQREMAKNRFTIDELMEELRMKGVTDISTVKYAILETNGQISVLPYADQKPPVGKDLGLSPTEGGLPVILVNDGRVLEANLKHNGYDHTWLLKEIKKHGAKKPEEVYLLTVDEQGKVFYAPKEG